MKMYRYFLLLFFFTAAEAKAQHEKHELANLIGTKAGAKIVDSCSEMIEGMEPKSIINAEKGEEGKWQMKNRPDGESHWLVIALPQPTDITTFEFNTEALHENLFPGITANLVTVEYSNLSETSGFQKAGEIRLKKNKNGQILTINAITAKWLKVVVESNWGYKYLTEMGRIYAYNDVQFHEFELMLTKEGKLDVYGIHFDPGSAEIKSESYPIIGMIGEILINNPDMKIMVEGHTDNVGNPSTNVTLSKSRAQNVTEQLAEIGVDKERLKFYGYGKTKPIVENDTEEGKARNRRVTFKVIQ